MQEEFDYHEWKKKFREKEEEKQRYYEDLFHLPGKNIREPEYLIEGFLPEGYLAIMAGDPKIGKTCLATAIAFAIANGSDFANLKTKQGSVLWLSLEESPQERAAALGSFEQLVKSVPEWPEDNQVEEITGWRSEDIANLPLYTCYERIPIDTEEGIAALEYWSRETRAKLIVVDPLHAAHSGRSLTDGWSARKTLQLIKRFCTTTKVSVLLLHHLSSYGKNLRVAESAQLSACASMFMLLAEVARANGHKDDVDSSENLSTVKEALARAQRAQVLNLGLVGGVAQRATNQARRILQLACKGRGAVNRTLFFQSNSPQHFELFNPPIIPLAEPTRRTAEDLILETIDESNDPICAIQIIQKTLLAQSTVRNALLRLEAKNQIRLAYILSGTRYYKKVEPEENEENEENGENGENGENECGGLECNE